MSAALPAPEKDGDWYKIGEKWDLYKLKNGIPILGKIFVDFIHVYEQEEGFRVDHYDVSGSLIRTLTLDTQDLSPVLDDRTPCDRPPHA